MQLFFPAALTLPYFFRTFQLRQFRNPQGRQLPRKIHCQYCTLQSHDPYEVIKKRHPCRALSRGKIEASLLSWSACCSLVLQCSFLFYTYHALNIPFPGPGFMPSRSFSIFCFRWTDLSECQSSGTLSSLFLAAYTPTFSMFVPIIWKGTADLPDSSRVCA